MKLGHETRFTGDKLVSGRGIVAQNLCQHVRVGGLLVFLQFRTDFLESVSRVIHPACQLA
jgi:hypothetical protein